MKSYKTVFTGNLNDVQRVFNNLATQHICAIIRIKSNFERVNYPGDLNETLEDILVHPDDYNRSTKVIDNLIGKNASRLVKMNSTGKPTRRHYV